MVEKFQGEESAWEGGRETERHTAKPRSSSGGRAEKESIRSDDSPGPQIQIRCLSSVPVQFPECRPPKKYLSDNSRGGQPNTNILQIPFL